MAQGRLGLDNDVTGVSGGDAAVGGGSNRLHRNPAALKPNATRQWLPSEQARKPSEGQMPPSKKRAAPPAETEVAKKFKSAMDSMADDWICPITTELPLDPVTAEDGRVYERAAIEQAIRVQGAGLKSPMTNLPMGPRLLALPQARSTIEKLVRSGAIAGDKAEQWLERLSEEEEVKEAVQKAEGGDVYAMHTVGCWYYHGNKGLATDLVAAARWWKKGAELDDATCMAYYALACICGLGTAKDVMYGVTLKFQAATMGSKSAASDVGDWLWFGRHGLKQDVQRAKYWYRKVATNSVKDLDQEYIDEAAERLLLDGPA